MNCCGYGPWHLPETLYLTEKYCYGQTLLGVCRSVSDEGKKKFYNIVTKSLTQNTVTTEQKITTTKSLIRLKLERVIFKSSLMASVKVVTKHFENF
jgi:hypothetical protein